MAVTRNESEIRIDRISSNWPFVIPVGSFKPFPRIRERKGENRRGKQEYCIYFVIGQSEWRLAVARPGGKKKVAMNGTRRFIKSALNMPGGNPCRAELKRLAPSSSIKVGGRRGRPVYCSLRKPTAQACIPILCKALIACLGSILPKAISSIFHLVAGIRAKRDTQYFVHRSHVLLSLP